MGEIGGNFVDMGIIPCEVEIPSTTSASTSSCSFLTGLPIVHPSKSSSNINVSWNEESFFRCRDATTSLRAAMSALLSGPLSHLLYSRTSHSNDGQSGATVWLGAPTVSDVQPGLGFLTINARKKRLLRALGLASPSHNVFNAGTRLNMKTSNCVLHGTVRYREVRPTANLGYRAAS